MSYSNIYIPGDRIIDCDICGFTYRYSQMRRGVSGSQNGLVVCPKDYDHIHERDTKRKLSPSKPLPKVK